MSARRVVGWVLAAVLALGLAAPVWAHAELISSDPPAGATVPAGLRQMSLTFSEPLAAGSEVVVYQGQFEPVTGVTGALDGAVLRVFFTTALHEGLYTVQWTAVGSDGHPVEGSYQFAVSPAAGAGQGAQIMFVATLLSGFVGLALVLLLAVLVRRRRAAAAAKS